MKIVRTKHGISRNGFLIYANKNYFAQQKMSKICDTVRQKLYSVGTDERDTESSVIH